MLKLLLEAVNMTSALLGSPAQVFCHLWDEQCLIPKPASTVCGRLCLCVRVCVPHEPLLIKQLLLVPDHWMLS
jgi:hypothetical protein